MRKTPKFKEKSRKASRKFFIHIPKSAGTSVRYTPGLKGQLRSAQMRDFKNGYYTKMRNRLKYVYGANVSLNIEHARWIDLSTHVQNTNIFFTVVRNPWSRVVSRYLYFKRLVKENRIKKDRYPNFEYFVDSRPDSSDNQDYLWHKAVASWHPSFDYVSDKDGIVRADVLRYENIEHDISNYFNTQVIVAKRNLSNQSKIDYKELYTQKYIDIIADHYKKDIDYWGFDFDSSAKRNYYTRK